MCGSHVENLTQGKVIMNTMHASLHSFMKKGILQSELGKATKEWGAGKEKLFTIRAARSKDKLHYSSTKVFLVFGHYVIKPC